MLYCSRAIRLNLLPTTPFLVYTFATRLTFGKPFVRKQYNVLRVATNLENSGNLKNCQISGKFEFLWNKTWKTQGKCKICDIIASGTVFLRSFFS